MLDAAKLRKRGVPSVVVAFDTFFTAAQDQARAMAMPDIPIIVIPHIRAREKPEDFRGRADAALAEITAKLKLPESGARATELRVAARA